MSKTSVYGHTTQGGYTLKRAVRQLGNRAIARRADQESKYQVC